MEGDQELAILLNQLVFLTSGKDCYLPLTQVKKHSFSYRHPVTLAAKLQKLINYKLITKQKDTLYNANKYKAYPEVYRKDMSVAAVIEGKDMRSSDSYLEAALINKFRHLATLGILKLQLSASEGRTLVQSDKCSETLRRNLKKLVKKGLCRERLVGRVKEYEFNLDKLLDNRTPEAVLEQAGILSETFKHHISYYCKRDVLDDEQKRWKGSFAKMLNEGYSFEALQHIIAYLPQISSFLVLDSPAKLKRNYETLYEKAFIRLSKHKAKKYL